MRCVDLMRLSQDPAFARNAASERIGAPYPLGWTFTRIGIILGLLALVLFADILAGVLVLALFTLVGVSWQRDMLPVLPAVLSYQFFALSIGYWFYSAFGYFPGGVGTNSLESAVLLSALAIFCLLFGFRLGFRLLYGFFRYSLIERQAEYSVARLFGMTVVLNSFYIAFSIVPAHIWFGGAQILSNVMMLRYLPYFILLVVVFERRRGYSLAICATILMILPELLTGFSRFKEILLFVVIAALTQWRPWVASRRQKITNRIVVVIGGVFSVTAFVLGLIWTGGLKAAWREVIWGRGDAPSSTIDRLSLFFELASRTISDFNLTQTLETLVGRFSSGTLYFAYTLERVPMFVPFQDGRLLALTLENLKPRFLFPEKRVLGGDSWIVREFAGITVAGDETGASIGLGWPAEFYIDFGVVGVVSLSLFFGIIVASCLALVARVARNREIFFGLSVAILTSSVMSIDGSFIKLLPGLIQRTLIAAVIVASIGRPILRLVQVTNEARPTVKNNYRAAV